MLLGALLCAAALLLPAGARAALHGAPALLALALLAAYTAISIIWSLAPSDSWIEAEPHVRLPRGVRRHDGARAARARPLAGAAARDRARVRGRLRAGRC